LEQKFETRRDTEESLFKERLQAEMARKDKEHQAALQEAKQEQQRQQELAIERAVSAALAKHAGGAGDASGTGRKTTAASTRDPDLNEAAAEENAHGADGSEEATRKSSAEPSL
jgi:hypothetical protein